MRTLKTLGSGLVVTLVLVMGLDYAASAATGHQFILGKVNKANKPTTLKRTTAGPPLQLLSTSPASPPMVVNGRGKVANLNADTVDGMEASALRTTTYAYTKAVTVPTTSVDFEIPLAVGTYVVGYTAYSAEGGLDGSTAGCALVRNHAGTKSYLALTEAVTITSLTPGVNGSSTVSLEAGDTLNLFCQAPTAWVTPSKVPIQVHATRTTLVNRDLP
jgi:hypothetical protein